MSGDRAWPALVLTAGLGTRLAPLSALRAKAALPVAGRPLVARLLTRLADAGVRRVVLNLHHRAETITRVVGDGSAWGLQVRYSWEAEVLGSGGGPARALPLLASDRFFIVNGDTLSDAPLDALAEAHVRSGAEATLAVTDADLTRYNALVTDRTGGLTGIARRGTAPPPDAHTWHFIGLQAVNASAFAGVDPRRPSDSLRDVYPRLTAARADAVAVFPWTGTFHDIGTPADYLRTCEALARAEGVPLDRGAGTVVAPSATVHASVLWDRVHVGAGAALSHCIVTDDVTIAAGARYDRVVITPDAVVPI